MNDSDGLPAGEVSRLTGITVRTLHHYDRIEPGLAEYVTAAIRANADR